MCRYALRFLVLFLLVASCVSADQDAVITYRKIFKGSVPEFTEIKVTQSGKCTFDIRQLSEEADPQPFEIGDALRLKIFALAGDLNDFRGADLDVHRRIANLGDKTFRYEKGSEVHETTFNYTTNPSASQLYQIFEGLTRQQEHILVLQRRMRYDRLGLNEALMTFETDYDRKLIPEPERLLPVLEQIANDNRIVDIARERARSIAARIRGAK
ncbi:MAG TPA: hypothetical protein VN862_05600 [Candidatus Acidoferrales bacterium]|nr:hypothetical protein [Candidatus Acidoferrales bacterium]